MFFGCTSLYRVLCWLCELQLTFRPGYTSVDIVPLGVLQEAHFCVSIFPSNNYYLFYDCKSVHRIGKHCYFTWLNGYHSLALPHILAVHPHSHMLTSGCGFLPLCLTRGSSTTYWHPGERLKFSFKNSCYGTDRLFSLLLN